MIRMLFQRVNIRSHGPLKQSRILRDYPQLRPQIMQPDLRNIEPIDQDLTLCGLHHPKQSLDQRRFPAPSSSNHPDLFSSRKSTRDSSQNRWESRVVLNV